MKILNYSVIVILAFSMPAIFMSGAFAQNDTSYPPLNDLGDGNVFYIATHGAFLPGQTIEITGNLVIVDSIRIALDDPDGKMVTSKTTFSDRDGYFASELKIPSDAGPGIWKIVGTSGIYHRELNFTIAGNSDGITCYGGDLCSKLIANNTVQNDSKPPVSIGIKSPLKQFESGIFANDVKCEQGFQLVIKAEDNSPACVKPQTTQKLVEQSWARSNHPESSISITESSTEYSVGQPINATVHYTGWMNGGLYPDVKILNAVNRSKVWSNCLYTHTELPGGGGIGTATYNVQCFDKYPVINETGDYVMIASEDNSITSAKFTIVNPLIPHGITDLESDAGIVAFGNRTYYFETPHYTQNVYVNPTQISFHDVAFTLFPSGYRGGLPIPCSTKGLDQYYWTDANFTDGTGELLHILVDDPPCTSSIPSMFSNHANPQAGLIFYNGKMKLLVSTDVANSTANGPEFKVGQDLLGPIPHQLVFFMKSNSTAKIFVEYTSREPNTGTMPSYSSVYVGKGDYTPLITSDVTINAVPSSIPLTENSDTIVVYNITAKEGVKGVYWIFLAQFCGVMPLAVDINSLTISPFDIPVQTGTMSCPAQVLDGKILGISGGTAEYKVGQPVK